MKSRIVPLIAVATLAGYLGILVWKISSLDLAIIIAITLVLAIWDIYIAAFKSPKGS